MLRRFWSILFVISLIIFGLFQQNTGYASPSRDVLQHTPQLDKNQTIPSRTPTPGPTATKNSGGGGPTAVPTSTIEPTSTTTPTPKITIAFTPVGGFMPTAEACSNHPTIQAQNLTNIRTGPGANYSTIAQLVYLEVRPILGRAADAAWWLILLDDGETGWVADDVVIVEGYTDIVPIVPAPPLNGATPTAGAPWNPTPPPSCTVTPTATPTATVMAAPTDTATAAPPTLAATTESSPSPANTAPPQPTQTAVSPPTLIPTAAAVNNPTPLPPVDPPPAGGVSNLLLPAAGALALVAIAVVFLKRRSASS